MSIYWPCSCTFEVYVKLSFIFVIVCSLFEWKQTCPGLVDRLCIQAFVLSLEIQLSRVYPVNRFNQATFLCLSQTRKIITNVMCYMVFLCPMIWGERWLFVLLILVDLFTITDYDKLLMFQSLLTCSRHEYIYFSAKLFSIKMCQ